MYITKDIEIDNSPKVGIQLTNEKFSDILFYIDDIKFSHPNPDEDPLMSFNYNIVEGEDVLCNDDLTTEFQRLTGDLIIHILEKQIENNYEDVAFTGGI